MGDNWNPHTDGGKLPGISGTYGVAGWGGRPSHGDDGWSARGTFGTQLSPGNPLGSKNPIGYYCYHAEMTGDYGEIWRWITGYRGYLENNRWYCIEQYAKMNTLGTNDGVLRGWVDGRLAFEKTDISFRTVENLKIEEIWMNIYHGGTAVSPENMDLYFDNVVIAKRYIGPMASSTNINDIHSVKTPPETGASIELIRINGIVHIIFTSISDRAVINVFDTAGRLIKKFTQNSGQGTIALNLEKHTVPGGLYFIQIRSGKNVLTKHTLLIK